MALIQGKQALEAPTFLLNLFPIENRRFPSFRYLKWRYYMPSIGPFRPDPCQDSVPF